MRVLLMALLDTLWSRPLGLPTGSVRAILAIAVVGVVLLEIRASEGPVPVEIIGLVLLVLGGYGFIRREQAQAEQHRLDMVDMDNVRDAAIYRARQSYEASLLRKSTSEEGSTGTVVPHEDSHRES